MIKLIKAGSRCYVKRPWYWVHDIPEDNLLEYIFPTEVSFIGEIWRSGYDHRTWWMALIPCPYRKRLNFIIKEALCESRETAIEYLQEKKHDQSRSI